MSKTCKKGYIEMGEQLYLEPLKSVPGRSVSTTLDIQATVECGFTLKCMRDMTRTYSQMHHTDKYSEHSSIIWPVWPNG